MAPFPAGNLAQVGSSGIGVEPNAVSCLHMWSSRALKITQGSSEHFGRESHAGGKTV